MNKYALDSITICMGGRHNQRFVFSNSKFFIPKNDYKVRDDGKCLTISNIGIDYKGKTHKATKCHKGVRFTIISDMPCGNYNFDEESNCDEVKICYK